MTITDSSCSLYVSTDDAPHWVFTYSTAKRWYDGTANENGIELVFPPKPPEPEPLLPSPNATDWFLIWVALCIALILGIIARGGK